MYRALPPHIREGVRAAAAAGVSVRAIANKYGIGTATVRRFLRGSVPPPSPTTSPAERKRPLAAGLAGLRLEAADPATSEERRAECLVLIAEWERLRGG